MQTWPNRGLGHLYAARMVFIQTYLYKSTCFLLFWFLPFRYSHYQTCVSLTHDNDVKNLAGVRLDSIRGVASVSSVLLPVNAAQIQISIFHARHWNTMPVRFMSRQNQDQSHFRISLQSHLCQARVRSESSPCQNRVWPDQIRVKFLVQVWPESALIKCKRTKGPYQNEKFYVHSHKLQEVKLLEAERQKVRHG